MRILYVLRMISPIRIGFLFKLDNFIRTELTNHLLLAQSYWMLFEEESTLHFYSTIEPTRRSIWPRLALTADKTWMITTPVHYQRRSSSSSSHRSTHRVVVGSGSLCRFTSFITYPFLLLFFMRLLLLFTFPAFILGAGAGAAAGACAVC